MSRKIAFIAYESPYAPCAGIAAVMGHLPVHLQKASGTDVIVVTPFHHQIEKTKSLEVTHVSDLLLKYYGQDIGVEILQHYDENGISWYFLRPSDLQFFAGYPHPYAVGKEQWEIRENLLRDSLLFGAAVAKSLYEIDKHAQWIMLMQDWEAATSAIALGNRDDRYSLFLTLHNSYDSGAVSVDRLWGTMIDPETCPHPNEGSTILERVIPVVGKPVLTVSKQFAYDFLEDKLQTVVMANHLQGILRDNVYGIDNGPFANLAVPEEILTESGRKNYSPIAEWKKQQRSKALKAINSLIPFSIELGFQRDLENRNFSERLRQHFDKVILPQNVTIQIKEGQDTWEIHNEDGDIVYFIKEEDGSLKIYNSIIFDKERPIWGEPAKFRQDYAPWFVLAGRDDTRQKGYDVAASAIARFLMTGGNARFLFFPIPGDEGRNGLNFLKSLAEKYPESVIVFPFRWREGFFEVLRGSTYGVMPSLYEPFGMANEFYLNGTVGIARATGGLIQQIVPIRSVASFSQAVQWRSERWHSKDDEPTGILYHERDDIGSAVEDWGGINWCGYDMDGGEDNRIRQREQYTLFWHMLDSLLTSIADGIQIYQNNPELYYKMLTEGIRHIQSDFSWERTACEYTREIM